ncbi:MAG: hypothetical protein Q8932_06885 [Bacteroidota bacterium]|nr:hypothetical protein [Bacteroidota bacterium]MDP4245554.1 hypothetical protein [Bacteroidota bacterium]MDP4256165.1 hypothetical protein [Bacteroidota bacterium]MDP4257323.1 hypothetical protein [Bacteroidota bacterium]
MKTAITILMLMLIALTGLVSFHFFSLKDYNISSLLTVTAYLSMVTCVYLLTEKKRALQ